jgi:hypothetical protein
VILVFAAPAESACAPVNRVENGAVGHPLAIGIHLDDRMHLLRFVILLKAILAGATQFGKP